MPVYAIGRRRRKRFWIPLLIIAAFGLSIFGAVRLTGTVIRKQTGEAVQEPSVMTAEQPTASPSATPGMTFLESSVLSITYLHSCGHTSTATEPVPAEFIGKTLEEVRRDFPAYNVTSFSTGTSLAEKRVNTTCDSHYLLRLNGQQLVVTYWNDPQRIRQQMPIDINLLPFETIEILNKGIFIDSETELLEFLEDFAS